MIHKVAAIAMFALSTLLLPIDQARAEDSLQTVAVIKENCSSVIEIRCRQELGDTELASMRGGFFTAEGAQFDFGANVQTLVNGQLALQTTMNWTPSGISVQQASNAGPATAPQVASATITEANLRSSTATRPEVMTTAANSGAALPIIAFANVGNGQLQNILINRADSQTITQNTNITFTIYNFTAWQQQLSQNALSAQVVNEIRAASGLGGSK